MLENMKVCLKAAGSSLENVLKCTVYITNTAYFEGIPTLNQYGMAIIEERSRAINAKLAIESAPDDGTELALSLPLSSSAFTASRSQ